MSTAQAPVLAPLANANLSVAGCLCTILCLSPNASSPLAIAFANLSHNIAGRLDSILCPSSSIGSPCNFDPPRLPSHPSQPSHPTSWLEEGLFILFCLLIPSSDHLPVCVTFTISWNFFSNHKVNDQGKQIHLTIQSACYIVLAYCPLMSFICWVISWYCKTAAAVS